MSSKAVAHDTFTIERTYKAPPERVFAAWSNPEQKRAWFVEGEGWTIDAHEMDFREGGFERSRFRFGDGPPMTNDAYYYEILSSRRIVNSYEMTLAGKRFSVSLSTLEFEPAGSGTRLRYTEQIVFFDGADTAKNRREGCLELFGKLAEHMGE